MGKGSLAKITVALAIISVYIYLFGIVGTVESLDSNMPKEISETEETEITEKPPITEAVTETKETEAVTDNVIYTYSTELNVVNGKKPSLADYTATEPLLIIAEHSVAAAPTPVTTADFEFDDEDFDYTTPVKTTTTPATTTTTTETTTSATTVLTPASTQIITVETTNTTTAATTTEGTTTTTEATTTTSENTTTTTTTTEATTTTTTTEVATTTTTSETTTGTDPLSWMDQVTEDTTTTTTPEETTVPETSVASEMLTVNAGGTIVTDNAATIVAKAVMAEVGDSFSEEALKAQAIATYTYIKYYNQNNSNAYVIFKTPSDKIIKCVNEVIGIAIRYNGELIQSVYSASTAGYTASSLNVWGVDYPYLRSVRTEFDAIYDINYGRQAVFSSEEVKNLVEKNTGIALSENPADWFKITSRIDGAYVGSLAICGQESYTRNGNTININGRVFRETIMEYGIRSASFDISYTAENDTFTFTTYGYGHGVGMSQHGANILATQYGYNYAEILQFYYQGTTIS